jgi:hypothetical protein
MHVFLTSNAFAHIPKKTLHNKFISSSKMINTVLTHQIMYMFRVTQCLMLAILLSVIMPMITAVRLGTTDDGMSVPGMFFAKLSALERKHMREVHDKVCLRVRNHCICMLLYPQFEATGLHLVSCCNTGFAACLYACLVR